MIRNYKGITTIELLVIAVLIITLLVVTGSQLMAYNYQSANAAAAADCRNAATAEKAFHAQWGAYASSGGGGLPGTVTVWIKTAHGTGSIPRYAIDGYSKPSADIPAPGFDVPVSEGVGVVIHTSMQGGSYTIGCKNFTADRCFGMDSDAPEMHWMNGNLGSGLTTASIPVAIEGMDDFTPGGFGVAGAGVCNGSPAGAGVISWTSL